MSKFDKLFKKVESFHKLAVFSDRKEFFKAIAQDELQSTYNPTTIGEVTVEGDKPQTVLEQVISAYPPIDKKEQEELSKWAVTNGKIAVPLTIDGVLGPKTKAALDAYKAANNFTALTDKEVLTNLMQLSRSKPIV